jgi:hypothetical protein
MARTRTLAEMRAEAYLRSDNNGATDRHPNADVDRYVNQGIAELYDLLVEARGRSYYRKNSPTPITTSASTSKYALPTDFYRLLSVRVDEDGGDMLDPFRAEDEPYLRQNASATRWPTHYELQNGFIELLPEHEAGISVVVDYIPHATVLSAGGDTFDGINGWEEYVVCFAAQRMATRDEDWEVVAALRSEMDRLRERIQKLAPNRDAYRAERVKDTRGQRWWRA